MLIESELRIQTVDGKKTDDMNFPIPNPKLSFILKKDITFEESKQV
jgi:hypothetical protein